jgi:FAD/FMN-containing dehydrogenase
MATTTPATTTNGRQTLQNEALEAFRTDFSGPVITPSDSEYDAARSVWNGMIDRRPALVVRCTGVADVAAAVKFARSEGLQIAVRGGAHSAAGHGTSDGGIVIDLSRMKGVRVDPRRRTAHAQAGLLWSELDRETQAYGLATTGGTVSNTGISGLTLGGGLGWLMGKHGLTCDNVVSFDLVTASGEIITASEDQHPDLFWALRGGGGNFGVVTSFEYRLHPVAQVWGGMIMHPMSEATKVLRFYRELTHDHDDDLEFYSGLMSAPDGTPVVSILAGYNGPAERGEKALSDVKKFGSPVADMIGPMSYNARQHMLDASAVHGLRRYWKSGFVDELSDSLIDLLVARANQWISPMTTIVLFNMHGAAERVGPQETAFGLRGHLWDVDIISQWADPADDARQVSWERDAWNEIEPFAGKAIYVNHIAGDEPDRVESAFGPNFARLQQVKSKYDPDNLFKLNHNIPPA